MIADIFRKPVKVKDAPEGTSDLELMEAAILSMTQRALKKDKSTLFSLIRLAVDNIPEPTSVREPTPEEREQFESFVYRTFGIDPDTGEDLFANNPQEGRSSDSE